MTRYILHPGSVKRKDITATHHVSAADLIRYYNLSRTEHIVINPQDTGGEGLTHQEGDIHLYPQESGNYFDYGSNLLK